MNKNTCIYLGIAFQTDDTTVEFNSSNISNELTSFMIKGTPFHNDYFISETTFADFFSPWYI